MHAARDEMHAPAARDYMQRFALIAEEIRMADFKLNEFDLYFLP